MRIEKEVAPFELKILTITPEIVKSWETPDFQRLVVKNRQLGDLCLQLKDQGYLKTVIYLGVWNGKIHLIDGQYRMSAYLGSGLPYITVPAHITHYPPGDDGFKAMCSDFILINGHIKTPSANDLLKALEGVNPNIKKLASECPFIGYSSFRCKETLELSMTQILRSWYVSRQDVPTSPGMSAIKLGIALDAPEANLLVSFFKSAYKAWGTKDKALWNPLSQALCMWLHRRVVKRPSVEPIEADLTQAQFRKCLVALSSSKHYLESVGENGRGRLNDPTSRDPAYKEMVKVVRKQLRSDLISARLPRM